MRASTVCSLIDVIEKDAPSSHGCGVIQVFFGAVAGPAVAAADQ